MHIIHEESCHTEEELGTNNRRRTSGKSVRRRYFRRDLEFVELLGHRVDLEATCDTILGGLIISAKIWRKEKPWFAQGLKQS